MYIGFPRESVVVQTDMKM